MRPRTPLDAVSRAAVARRALVAGATLALAASASRAQTPRPGEGPAQLAPRCAARSSVLSAQDAAAAPDPAHAPAVVAADDGALVVWRTVRGAVVLARLDARAERRADDRELAGPAGPFAVVAVPGGAAVALVERGPRGDAVLLARVTSAGEARNVPREVGRGAAIDHVALAFTGTGFVVAWSTAGARPETFVATADARAVPRAPPRRLLEGRAPRVAHLGATGTTVLVAERAAGGAVAHALAENGTTRDSTSWPPQARGLVAGPGDAVYALALSPDAAGGSATLVRWTQGAAAPSETPVALRLAAGTSVAALAADRAGLVAALDEPGARELVVRFAPEGAVGLLATRSGTRGTLVPGADGAVTVFGHEPPAVGHGRLARVVLACPRPTPPAAGNGVATNAASGSPDAGPRDR